MADWSGIWLGQTFDKPAAEKDKHGEKAINHSGTVVGAFITAGESSKRPTCVEKLHALYALVLAVKVVREKAKRPTFLISVM